jgi:hypothetical protein
MQEHEATSMFAFAFELGRLRGNRMSFISMGLQRLAVGLLSVCLMSSACTTTRAVSPSRAATSESDIKAGRYAVILLRSGVEVKASIVKVSKDGLTLRAAGGGTQYVAYADMQSLHIREPANGRTVAAVIVGALVVAGGVFYLTLVQSLDDEE